MLKLQKQNTCRQLGSMKTKWVQKAKIISALRGGLQAYPQ